MTGNLIADMLHIPDIYNLPDMLAKGVAIHRSIDTFTDAHPLVHECLTFIKPTSGRYASVVLDIFFDYILANNWSIFCDLPFPDFETHVYQSINHHLPDLPEILLPRISDMINHQWLKLYTYRGGLSQVLHRFQSRVSRPHAIGNADLGYDQNYPELEVRFKLFFEEIQAYMAVEFNIDSRWTTLQNGMRS